MCSYEAFGAQIEPKEECVFSKTENNFSRGSVGINHDAGTPVSYTFRFHPNHCKRQGQQLSVLLIHRLLGLMEVAANVIPLGLLHQL